MCSCFFQNIFAICIFGRFLLNHTCTQSYCQPFPYKFIITNFQCCICQHSNCFSWRNCWKYYQTRMFPPRLLALGRGREKEEFFSSSVLLLKKKSCQIFLVLIRFLRKKNQLLKNCQFFYFAYYIFIFLGTCAVESLVWHSKIKGIFGGEDVVQMFSLCH